MPAQRLPLGRLMVGTTGALALAATSALGAGGQPPSLAHLTPPTTLPAADGQRSAEAGQRWIVAVRSGSGVDASLVARRHGASTVDAELGILTAPEPIAARLAADLRRRGALWYAEPDVMWTTRGLPLDPLSNVQWWIPTLVPPELTPPPPGGPPVAVVDSGADFGHPDLAPHVVPGAEQRPDHDPSHGTGVASVVAAGFNGLGIVGVLPGQPTVVFPTSGACSETVRMVRIASSVANVINMSYGFDGGCFTHLIATELAIKRGVLPVAAAGNEFQEGNPLNRPANDPHVLNVGAVNPDLTSAEFSNENTGIDIVAPGVDIPVAVPGGGFALADGTSYSAPIVAAAASWIRRVRPGLDPIQTADALRDSARDLGSNGYDMSFGFGLVDLAGALTVQKAPRERREPNEDIRFVTGRTFGQTPLLANRRRETHVGFLDAAKDPVDVVPVRIRGRGAVRVSLTPRGADVDLEIFSSGARTVIYEGRTPPPTRIAKGDRAGTRRESLTIRNSSRSARKFYVAAFIGGRDELSAGYRLVVTRRA